MVLYLDSLVHAELYLAYRALGSTPQWDNEAVLVHLC